MDYQEQMNELKAKAQAEIDKIRSKLEEDVKALEDSYKAKTHYALEDYSNGVGYNGYYVTMSNEVDDTARMPNEAQFLKGYSEKIITNGMYPTPNIAHEAARMKQFNDDLLYFKYMYDREYSPDDYWSDASITKYYVYCDMPNAIHSVGTAFFCGYNTVYFSSYEIAQKCADFLNRKYKLGEYADEA
jgi:hypothetical protein